MIASQVTVNCENIEDWPSFHDEFVRAFGFPAFYGRNLDAWVDCLTYVDDPEAGMSAVHCAPESVLTLFLEHGRTFRDRCPEQYNALIDCAAFVNYRRNEVGESSVLALSYQ